MEPWREGYVAADGARFFVRALGQGDDLVILLHGWPETGRAWHRVAPILAEAGWRVACPDLKGFGRSSAPRRGYDPRTLAGEMSRLIRGLHVRKAALVGHDWGGAVALATAFRHPGRVRALCLINSPHRELDLRRAWHVPLFNVPVLPELAARLGPQALVRAAISRGAVVTEAFPDEVVEEYVAATRATPRGWLSYYRTLSRGVARDSARDVVRGLVPGRSPSAAPARLRIPTRVIWGEHDPVLPLDQGRRTADRLGADLVTVPGVGHFPHEEDPLTVASAILGLIGEPNQGPAAARATTAAARTAAERTAG